MRSKSCPTIPRNLRSEGLTIASIHSGGLRRWPGELTRGFKQRLWRGQTFPAERRSTARLAGRRATTFDNTSIPGSRRSELVHPANFLSIVPRFFARARLTATISIGAAARATRPRARSDARGCATVPSPQAPLQRRGHGSLSSCRAQRPRRERDNVCTFSPFIKTADVPHPG